MIAASIDGLDPWAAAEERARRTPLDRVRHHVQAVRDHEASAEATLAIDFAGRDAWARYLRGRIEGHALRAIVALLEALS